MKVQLSALDPLGLPLTSTIVDGSRADDPLYVPEIKKVQAVLGRHGLLYIGDCKMGSQASRAYLVMSGDYYCCPLSKVQLDTEELRDLLSPFRQGVQKLTEVKQMNVKGEIEVIAEGFEKMRSQEMKGSKTSPSIKWEKERLLIVRSIKLARMQERALRERVAKAQTEVRALNGRGRGKRRFKDVQELQQATEAILQRGRVVGLFKLIYHEQVHERAVRRYGEHEASIKSEREVSVEVVVDEQALADAIQELGWQVYATNCLQEQFSLDKLVLAKRS